MQKKNQNALSLVSFQCKVWNAQGNSSQSSGSNQLKDMTDLIIANRAKPNQNDLLDNISSSEPSGFVKEEQYANGMPIYISDPIRSIKTHGSQGIEDTVRSPESTPIYFPQFVPKHECSCIKLQKKYYCPKYCDCNQTDQQCSRTKCCRDCYEYKVNKQNRLQQASEKNQQPQEVKCNCKNQSCHKLYCQCLKMERQCTLQCSCVQCENCSIEIREIKNQTFKGQDPVKVFSSGDCSSISSNGMKFTRFDPGNIGKK